MPYYSEPNNPDVPVTYGNMPAGSLFFFGFSKVSISSNVNCLFAGSVSNNFLLTASAVFGGYFNLAPPSLTKPPNALPKLPLAASDKTWGVNNSWSAVAIFS